MRKKHFQTTVKLSKIIQSSLMITTFKQGAILIKSLSITIKVSHIMNKCHFLMIFISRVSPYVVSQAIQNPYFCFHVRKSTNSLTFELKKLI